MKLKKRRAHVNLPSKTTNPRRARYGDRIDITEETEFVNPLPEREQRAFDRFGEVLGKMVYEQTCPSVPGHLLCHLPASRLSEPSYVHMPEGDFARRVRAMVRDCHEEKAKKGHKMNDYDRNYCYTSPLEHRENQCRHNEQNKPEGNKMKIELYNYRTTTYHDGSTCSKMDITILAWEFTLYGIEEHTNVEEGRYFMYPYNSERPYMAFDSLELNKQFFKAVEIEVDKLLSKRPLEPKKKRKHYDKDNRLQNNS